MTAQAQSRGWESKIRFHVVNIQQCAETGDFGYVHAVKAQQLFNFIGHVDVLDDDKKKAADAMKEIDTATAYSMQTIMSELTGEVEKLKEAVPDSEAWKTRILEQSAKAQKAASDAIKAASNTAIETIGALPAPTREFATDAYITTSGLVGNLLNSLIQQLQGVLTRVTDFLKGIWSGIKNAYHTVVGAVESVVDKIKGLFTLVPAAKGGHFVGRLNWPATVGIAIAVTGLSYVCSHLAEKGVEFHEQTVKTEEVDGKKVIITETHIGFKNPRDVPGKQLEQVWKDCDGDLGADGHWVPIHGV